MYFESRWQAGEILARELFDKYRYENCSVIALSDGGAIVGEQVASWLHSSLSLLVTESIEVPGESLSLGSMSQDGSFTYNSALSSGQVDGFNSEYQGYLGEQKRAAFQKINRLIGDGGTIDIDLLKGRVLILVSDGLHDVTVVDAALSFLKPIKWVKLIVAAPVASVEVVDMLHVMADELHILDVKDNFFDTNHYYSDNEIPSHEDVIKIISAMLLKWR